MINVYVIELSSDCEHQTKISVKIYVNIEISVIKNSTYTLNKLYLYT